MTDDNNNDLKDVSKPEVSSGMDTNRTEEQENAEIKSEFQEIKKLEEKEHYELDFFSKEELVKKNEDLENQIKVLKEKGEKLDKDTKDSKNKFMHLQAEFENAQKRWDKNRQNLRIEYTSSVLKSFLPLYDSFKKAIESINEKDKEILTGFYNQFMSVLKSYGVEPIKVNVNDQFDYNLHEGLSTIEKDDVPENSILEVIQDGFKYGKEVIRYAKVIISRKPKPPEPKPEEKKIEEGYEEKPIEEQKQKEQAGEDKEIKNKKLKKEKEK